MNRERTSLLEELRSEHLLQKRHAASSAAPTEAEERHRMNRIVERVSEFPSKLRPAIREAAGDDPREIQPGVFLNDVYRAVEGFFFGRRPNDSASADGDDDDEASEQHRRSTAATTAVTTTEPSFDWWHGPDSDVDTVEEIEVAVRFFPSVLNAKYFEPFSPLNGCCPLYALLRCSKSMAFIPLLAELGAELGRFGQKQRGGLTRLLQNVFFHLVCNRITKEHLREDLSEKLDKLSTAIMMSLKDKGLMKVEDISAYSLVNLLLYRAINTEKLRIESRLRFMIDWNPCILKDCGRSLCLLYHFMHIVRFNEKDTMALENLRRFQLIFRLGMKHHPNELGFLFDNRMFLWTFEEFGTAAVEQMIDDEITSKPEYTNRKTLQELVVAAASNDAISLDGVYILVRRDPIACLPDYSGGSGR